MGDSYNRNAGNMNLTTGKSLASPGMEGNKLSLSLNCNSSQNGTKLSNENGYGENGVNDNHCNGIGGHLEAEDDDIIFVREQDLQFFEHQVSGHGTAEKGLLKHKQGQVLKPLQAPPLGTREVTFYKQVFDKNPSKEEYFSTLQRFVPKFHGVACITNSNCQNGNGIHDGGDALSSPLKKYLVLDDVIQGFKKPCVADIKIGAQTWSPDASEAKIKQEMSKYKGTKIPLGLCLTGVHYYDICKNEKFVKSRDFCKGLNPTTLKELLKEFFNGNNSPSYSVLVRNVFEALKGIEQVFSVQKKFKIYGSSVLIAYDADCFNSEGVVSAGNGMISIRVFMIDFAHVHPSEDGKLDENYLFGLRNLIKIVCDIADSSSQN